MKISTLLPIYFLLISSSISSYAQLNSYQKLYLTDHFTTCFDVVPTPDQGYIITGFEDRPAPFNMPLVPYLAKIDCKGEMEWMKKYGSTTNIDNTDPRVAITDDGDYIMMSTVLESDYDILVSRTTPNGITVWQNTYGGSQKDVGRGMLKLSDGNLVVVGSTKSYGMDTATPYSDMYAIKINSATGDTLWTSTFGNEGGIDDLWALAEDDKGDLTFVGRSFYNNGIWLSIIRTDSKGKSRWIKVLGKTNHQSQAFDIQLASNGDYIITGMTTIAKADFNALVDVPVIRIDEEGNVLWAKVYHGNNPDFSEVGSTILESGNQVVIALETTSYPTNFPDVTKRLIYQLDAATGDLLLAKAFNGSGGQFPMIRKDWEGYIMSGFTDEFPGSWNDPMLVKLDDDFNSGCNETDLSNLTTTETPTWEEASPELSSSHGSFINTYTTDSIGTIFRDSTLCFEGITPAECVVINNTQTPSIPFELSIYPNPTAQLVNITFSQMPNQMTLSLYNMQGQVCLQKSNINEQQTQIDIKQLPKGAYILYIQMEDGKHHSRFVHKL